MGNKNKGIFFALISALIFFSFALKTLPDYGISWDEPIHFMRGQSYLHFFFTGEKKFDSISGNKSYYQNDQLTANYFLLSDSGHPPLNGILSALTNFIFYQKLGILGDVESYHLFNIFISAVLVFVVALFAFETFGFFAALVSAISISVYPLFFGESHFNIKDPAEAAFIALTTYTFWKAVNAWNWKWLIWSSVAFGFGLGTKFNVLFMPLILIPYLIYKIFFLEKRKIKINKKFLIALFISPIIVLIIFVGSWPYLWSDPFNKFLEIFGYYKQIGTGYNYQTAQFYLPFGFNLYPVLWIFYTTPPFILFLAFIGIVSSFINIRRKDGVTFLWLLWLFIPILRVSLPNTSIYGGVRQIMEYIPALALISGVGASSVKGIFSKLLPSVNPKLISLAIFLGFLQIVMVLIKIHPHENVYFNSFAGGLSGAKQKNLPSWGNSFGNAYYPAIIWINKNTETNANVALIQGTSLNIPQYILRKDIRLNNLTWSGSERRGEYLLELTHQSSVRAYPYAWDYVEKVLEPVYEVKVDGVAIAKVWKNDLLHSKDQFKKNETLFEHDIYVKPGEKVLMVKLSDSAYLTKIVIEYGDKQNCKNPEGKVAYSSDGKDFINLPDGYPSEFVTEIGKKENTIYYYFPINFAKFVKFIDKSSDSCLFDVRKVEVKGFE